MECFLEREYKKRNLVHFKFPGFHHPDDVNLTGLSCKRVHVWYLGINCYKIFSKTYVLTVHDTWLITHVLCAIWFISRFVIVIDY